MKNSYCGHRNVDGVNLQMYFVVISVVLLRSLKTSLPKQWLVCLQPNFSFLLFPPVETLVDSNNDFQFALSVMVLNYDC